MTRQPALTKEQLAADRAAVEEDSAYDRAKGGLAAAYRIVNLRKIDASQRLGPEHDITNAYGTELAAIQELEQRVIHFDETAYGEAYSLAREIQSKYGKKKIGELTLDDHLQFKKNGPG